MILPFLTKRLKSHFVIAPIDNSDIILPAMIRETIKACHIGMKMDDIDLTSITTIILASKLALQKEKERLSKLILNEFPSINRLLYLEDGVVEGIVDTLKALDNGNSCWWMPHSSKGKMILPRLAGSVMAKDGRLNDCLCLSDITAISEVTKTFERAIYAGNVKTTLKVPSSIGSTFITVRPTSSFENFKANLNNNLKEEKDLQLITTSTSKKIPIDKEIKESSNVDLSSADIVIAGGRGFNGRDEFQRGMLKVKDALSKLTPMTIAIGASRAAVDLGYCENELQIGQTGRQVAPILYIGFGISGAIQHISGIRDSKIIVAINKDKEAPIFSISDYGIIGDVNDVIEELTKVFDTDKGK